MSQAVASASWLTFDVDADETASTSVSLYSDATKKERTKKRRRSTRRRSNKRKKVRIAVSVDSGEED